MKRIDNDAFLNSCYYYLEQINWRMEWSSVSNEYERVVGSDSDQITIPIECACVSVCVCVRDVRMRESFPIQNYRIVYFSDDKSCESAIRNRLNYSLPQKAFNCWLPFSFSFSAPLFTHLFAFFHFVRNFMLLYHKNKIDTQAVWNAIESRMNERHCIMLPFV